jgi:hypothetical protein
LGQGVDTEEETAYMDLYRAEGIVYAVDVD